MSPLIAVVGSLNADLVVRVPRFAVPGETIRGVAADWNRRGIATVTSRAWTPHVLRRLLTSPRIAGLREHRGRATGPAVWPAIVDDTTHERLRALLLDPSRRVNANPRRYLLTGILVCGLCGARLVARPRGDKARCYVCASGPGFHGCGKIRALAETLEQYVAGLVCGYIDSDEFARAVGRNHDHLVVPRTPCLDDEAPAVG